ncbi:hypothetical protein, partial [Burkholderia sp. SIMBA_019]|uniref:hypothetical protein n=1 Tax=Burkholderia sp. SIMBA_019 TaxID=3085765 RepID=UPI003979B490
GQAGAAVLAVLDQSPGNGGVILVKGAGCPGVFAGLAQDLRSDGRFCVGEKRSLYVVLLAAIGDPDLVG